MKEKVLGCIDLWPAFVVANLFYLWAPYGYNELEAVAVGQAMGL